MEVCTTDVASKSLKQLQSVSPRILLYTNQSFFTGGGEEIGRGGGNN